MSLGPGVACVACETFMAPAKNGVYVLETYEDGKTPYKVWMADMLECPDCHAQIVKGFGADPVSEQYMDDFDKALKLVTITINGCPRRLDDGKAPGRIIYDDGFMATSDPHD